ncbi:MAG: undecaprenyl-diphosphate phosphatase, partial [Desulfoprunum sp.]|nr:undecaprenyl-diphosphate phosphatase [Desulfoprunum sp.]
SPAHTADTEPAKPAPQHQQTMTIGQAAILGVVEGLTEYLPVSSTGHLLLAERIMGIGDETFISAEQKQRTRDATDAYTICIQAGAIIAVLGLYFRRVQQMLSGILGRDPVGRQLFINISIGFLPAAVIGLLFNKTIKAWLFGPWPVVAAWLVGGVLILIVHWRNQGKTGKARIGLSLEEITWKMALVIGIAQCIAMWPGVSRSLITIVGGLVVGMSLPAAVEFSFLLGLLTLGAATAYDALKHGQEMLQTFDILSLGVGLIFAFFSAVIAIKWMVAYLNRHGLAIFGYYRVLLALVVAVLLMTEAV